MNPFLSVAPDGSEYVTSRCSLNRAVMAKLPLDGTGEQIEGLCFSDIFSTELLIAEIRSRARYFGVDISELEDRQLPRALDRWLTSKSIRERGLAQRVVSKFGNRLGLILLALKRGDIENRRARDDWDDSCWDYWRELSTVILTGGLSSSMLGRRFKEQILSVFDRAGVPPYQIMLFENGAYLGVMGAAQRLMRDDTEAVVFDLGQTNIKRAVVRKRGGDIEGFSPLETLRASFMETSFDTEEQRRDAALRLHRYLLNSIAESVRDAEMVHTLSDEIIVCIASYTYSGILDDERGGYAKLRLLGDNYALLLSNDLSGELRRPVTVRLLHDSTATALYFSNIENSVCITLGTGFGVGFPEIRIRR